MKNHFTCLLSVLLVSGTAVTSWAATSAQVVTELNPRLIGASGSYRAVPNQCKKVYVTVGGREYFYLHKESRLFPAKVSIPETKIVKFSTSTDTTTGTPAAARMTATSSGGTVRNPIRVEFLHPHLSKGEIKIGRVDGKPIDNSEDVLQILGYAFESEKVPPQKLFVGDQKTKLVYFAGVNHLPPVEDRVLFDTAKEAEAAGYKPTRLSFARLPQIPSFETELLLGLQASSSVRTYSPPDTDDKRRERVNRVGRKVLANWPTSLKGYGYKFYVLDMDLPNACACPTGWIFVNTGMLEMLESDDELEAILAHEISHVEKRHGLRTYRAAQTGAVIGGLLTLGIAAAAASDGKVNTTEAAIGISGVMVNLGSAIAMSGYSKTMETEADQFAAMYLLRNGKDPQLLARTLRKLRYQQDLMGRFDSSSGMFASHPALEERIEMAEHTTLKPAEKPVTFDGYSKDDELVATITFEAEVLHSGAHGQDTLNLIAELATTTALEKQDKVTSIALKAAGKTITLNNTEKTAVDPLDAITVSFQAKGIKPGLLASMEEIKFSLGPVKRWERRKEQ
jgi:Zn-dependent protease with chaperone function